MPSQKTEEKPDREVLNALYSPATRKKDVFYSAPTWKEATLYRKNNGNEIKAVDDLEELM